MTVAVLNKYHHGDKVPAGAMNPILMALLYDPRFWMLAWHPH